MNILSLEFFEVGDDLGAGPILRGDEFATEHSIPVDDVTLGDLESAVEVVDARGGVSDCKEVDVVLDEEAVVDRVVFVLADGNHDDIGHLALELNEAGKLFDTRWAPGSP